MKLKLPLIAIILTSLFAAFQAITPPVTPSLAQSASKSSPVAGSTQGNELVATSAAKLRQLSPFRVQLRLRINLFDQQLIGTGVYSQQSGAYSQQGAIYPQQGNSLAKHRLELNFVVDEEVAKLSQISNGRFLYRKYDLLEKSRLERVDLKQVRLEMEKSPTNLAATPARLFGTGDLSFTLEQFIKNFNFTAAQAGSIGDDSVWVLKGSWRRSALSRLLNGKETDDHSAATGAELKDLPPQIPHAIELTLWRNQQIPFPYRMVFLRSTGNAENEGEKVIVEIDFFNLESIQPRSEDFDFRPQDGDHFEDFTQAYIEQMTR